MYYIDLFAGAGGLSEGFQNIGFKPIAHVEKDFDACNTLRTRQAYFYLKKKKSLELYREYLRKRITREELFSHVPGRLIDSVINVELSDDSIKGVFDRIDQQLKSKRNSEVDLVIGGPPCQAYSLAGRAADKNKMVGDSRNYLYKIYARFLKKYSPRVFIFENVTGLFTAAEGKYFSNMKKYFRRLGYKLLDEPDVLNSKDFGVVQHRERVIIVGVKQGNFPDFNSQKLKKVFTASQIFEDLPEVSAGNSVIAGEKGYRARPNSYLEKFKIREEEDIVTQHISRPHNERDLKIYQLAIELLGRGIRIRNNEIPKNLRTQNNITAFLDRFKVVDPSKPSHTMIAHIAKDGHHFIHPDKKQLRSLSVREAARIQSFPDNFFFEGSRTASFRQIGNAVPPLMAKAIAKAVKKVLI